MDVGSDGEFCLDLNTGLLHGPKDSSNTGYPWPVAGTIGQQLRWRGDWGYPNTYNPGDVVQEGGSQYLCVKPVIVYPSNVNSSTTGTWDAGSTVYDTTAGGLYIAVQDAVSPPSATAALPIIWVLYSPANDWGISSVTNIGGSLGRWVALDRTIQAVSAGLLDGYPTQLAVPADGITNNELASDAVAAANIASNAVTTAKLADLSVTTGKLANDAVTSAKILNGTIATADIASGAITQPLLAASAVGETNISPYLTTGTSSPSAYFPATKLVSADTTLSGGAISTTNKAVDGKSLNYGLNGYSAPNGLLLPVGTRSATANQVWWTRFYCPADITVTKLACQIATASASATDWVDMGIYSTAGTLLASTGQITGTNVVTALVGTLGAGTGAKAGSANYALTGGTTYYIAAMTSAALSYGSCMASSGTALYGTTAGQFIVQNVTATGTTTSLNAATISFPSTATVTNTIGAGVFFVVRTA
jgi:hypothetical protein